MAEPARLIAWCRSSDSERYTPRVESTLAMESLPSLSKRRVPTVAASSLADRGVVGGSVGLSSSASA